MLLDRRAGRCVPSLPAPDRTMQTALSLLVLGEGCEERIDRPAIFAEPARDCETASRPPSIVIVASGGMTNTVFGTTAHAIGGLDAPALRYAGASRLTSRLL